MNTFGCVARRRVGGAAAAALLAGGVVGLGFVASPAEAEFGPGVSCAGTAMYPQFDAELQGEGPIGDCVVAVPDRTVAGAARAGAVEVAQTGAGHVVLTRASIGQGTGRANDRFGAAIAYANLDGDAYDDLVIGAPGVASGAGRVYVVYGSATGLGGGRATRVLSGGPAGSDFGSSLATSRTYLADLSVRERLLVGAPGTKIAGKADAGAVHRYAVRYRSADHGLIVATLLVEKTVTEAAFTKIGPARANERLGTSLATTSCGDYLGAPGEVVGKNIGAGAVVVVTGNKAARWTQDTARMAGKAEKGDAFGSAISVRLNPSRIAVGAPGEDVGKKKDAGSVTVVTPKKCPAANGSFTSRSFAQGTVPKSGAAESGDRYGASVAWFTGSLDSALLAVGAPGEDVGSKKDAGAIVRLGLDRNSCGETKSLCARVWTQSAGEYTGTTRAGNRFGTSIGLVRSDDGSVATVVGAPGSSGGRGALSQARSMPWFDASWFRAQAGDRLGSVAPIG